MKKIESYTTLQIRVVLASLLLVLPDFLLICRASAQELHVEGNIQKLIYFNDKIHEEPTVHFSVNLKDHQWQIQYSTWQGEHAYDFAEAQYHGTNVSLAVFIGTAVKALGHREMEMGPNVALGTIYRGQVPNLENAEDLGVIWLAFASGDYFKEQTNGLAEPPFNRDVNSAMHFGPPDYFKMQASWTLSGSAPVFVSRLTYFNDGDAMSATGTYVKRPAPYVGRFTNSYYQVEHFKDVDGLRVPAVASLRVYRTRPGAAASTDLDLLFDYRVVLEEASRHVNTMPADQWLPITAVTDFRAKTRSGAPFTCYFATNCFPTDYEAQNISIPDSGFITVAESVRRHFIKNVARTVLYMLLLGPAWILFYRFRSNINACKVNPKLGYCLVILIIVASAFISIHLYGIDRSAGQNRKASESTMTAACGGHGQEVKTNDAICEFDGTPGCPGCQDSQDGTSVLIYRGEGIDDYHYVNCMDRHYWGYCSYGQGVAVIYTDSGVATRHLIYTTVRRR